ncbi:MAG TPA: FtsL-like putative cell division protein [Chitinophagales bacterium]|nr:FtsL-like putative cell division protein [Chitinophagales bacterium]
MTKSKGISGLANYWLYRLKSLILSGQEVDERALIANNLRYIFFLAFIAIIYIANTRLAERNMRQINTLEKELKELRWQYITAKTKLMTRSKQTEVVRLVTPLGLEELKEPPKKIVMPR